jgi:phosphoglycerate dehydrogenase-like enzyme
MRVKGYTRASEDSADVDQYFHGSLVDVASAFGADLDYLVCVMPDTRATRHLVDDTLLRALPPRAVFVNPGRGGAMDEGALESALQRGGLGGAVLDLRDRPPLHIFWRCRTCASRSPRRPPHRADLHRKRTSAARRA